MSKRSEGFFEAKCDTMKDRIKTLEFNNAELVVTSTSSKWHHSPLLGEDGDSVFNCKEFDEISDSCVESYEHNMMIDSQEVVMRGRASLELPKERVGYERADNE